MKPTETSRLEKTEARQLRSDESPEPAVFVYRLRVGWSDCDPARIAYTGRLPAFALEAIDAWWERHIGYDWFRLNLDRNVGTPFVHLDVDFRAPVTPRAPLDCHVILSRLGDKSVEFAVHGYQDDTLCFEGRFVSVFVISDKFETISVPTDLRTIIEPLVATRSDVSRDCPA